MFSILAVGCLTTEKYTAVWAALLETLVRFALGLQQLRAGGPTTGPELLSKVWQAAGANRVCWVAWRVSVYWGWVVRRFPSSQPPTRTSLQDP